MAGYVWNQDSFDFAGSGNIISLPSLPITIPANCTLKKFLITNTYVNSHITGTQANAMASLFWKVQIHFTAGAHSGRTIFNANFGIPMVAIVVNTSGGLTNYYDCYSWGGDKEFGVDQKCSYGKNGDPAATLSLDGYVATEGFPGQPTISAALRLSATLRTLYYQH